MTSGTSDRAGQTIDFSPPDLDEDDIAAVVEVLRSGWITTGPVTKAFERDLSEFVGTPRTVAVSSATAALELTLRLLGVGPGDEVITPAYTYTASASVIEHVGARIVLVDSPEGEYHVTASAIADAVTPRTKAVIPVDLGGVPCDHPAIIDALASRAAMFRPASEQQEALGRVAVIADAAHSLGAVRGGIRAGAAADFTCFSMHAVKNLTTGEGGAVTWAPHVPLDAEETYTAFMLLSLHGQTVDALAKSQGKGWRYDVTVPGYKANMTDISAALGRSQLQRYPAKLERRRELARLYRALLPSVVSTLRHDGPDLRSSAHLMMVDLAGRGIEARDALIAHLAGVGIPTNVHYQPLPLLTAYRRMGFDAADYPHAMRLYENEITLPLHTRLRDSDVERIVDAVRGHLER